MHVIAIPWSRPSQVSDNREQHHIKGVRMWQSHQDSLPSSDGDSTFSPSLIRIEAMVPREKQITSRCRTNALASHHFMSLSSSIQATRTIPNRIRMRHPILWNTLSLPFFLSHLWWPFGRRLPVSRIGKSSPRGWIRNLHGDPIRKLSSGKTKPDDLL